MLLSSTPAAAQEGTPLIVDADQIVYDEATQEVEATGNVRLRYRNIRLAADSVHFDLKAELLTARGRVVLIDPEGREMRGEQLTYDVRLGQATLLSAESLVDRIYVRSAVLRAQRDRMFADEGMVTTCNPERPIYRVTARQFEIIPGDRIIARRATLWLGRFAVLTLPVYVMPLGDPEEKPSVIPGFGYNNADGFWLDYLYPYRIGNPRAYAYAKYGMRTGLMPRTFLEYRSVRYTVSLSLGRTQDTNLSIYDQAEVQASLRERQIETHPVWYSASAKAGWFSEKITGVTAMRNLYQLGLRTSSIPLGPLTSLSSSVSWQDAFYGNGTRQGVLSAGLGINHLLSVTSWLQFAYTLVERFGVSPFVFDGITDIPHTVSLLYGRAGVRGQASTVSSTGALYDFRSATTTVTIGYIEQVIPRYHLGVTAGYTLGTNILKLTTDSGVSLGYNTYLTVQAIYNVNANAFEDLDYILTSRLCECIDLLLRYRQVRQEIWFEVSLTGYPDSRLTFLFPRP